jgi:hypothetical protein
MIARRFPLSTPFFEAQVSRRDELAGCPSALTRSLRRVTLADGARAGIESVVPVTDKPDRQGALMGRRLRRNWPILAVGIAAVAILVFHFVAAHLSRERDSYPRTNYSSIEEGLYLGGILEEPPPGTRAVLNVGETKDPYSADVYCWEPIPDTGPAPSLDWLRRQVEFITEQRRAGFTVFVHCRAGISRSGMVVAAYLMARDGYTRDEAIELLRTKRPRVGPNPAFMELLLAWEEAVKTSRGRAPPLSP